MSNEYNLSLMELEEGKEYLIDEYSRFRIRNKFMEYYSTGTEGWMWAFTEFHPNKKQFKEIKPTKEVYEWRWRSYPSGRIWLSDILMTKEEAKEYFTDKHEIHAGPFKVEDI